MLTRINCPLGAARGFRPRGNPGVVGAILSFETALNVIVRCPLAFDYRVALHRLGEGLHGT